MAAMLRKANFPWPRPIFEQVRSPGSGRAALAAAITLHGEELRIDKAYSFDGVVLDWIPGVQGARRLTQTDR